MQGLDIGLHLMLIHAILSRLGRTRKATERDILRGQWRSFQWYWNEKGEMPALDAYERLTHEQRAAFLAALEHWGGIGPGERTLESRIAKEHDDPLILAVKARDVRFPAFQHQGDLWIITTPYKKRGQKLDKAGKRGVNRAIRARADYANRHGGEKHHGRT